MENITNEYEILVNPRAYRDIEDIYKYISSEILEPIVAKQQTDRIWDALSLLSTFPYSHQDRIVGRYAGKGYKQLLIDNYIVIYRITEDKKIVTVVTVQYAGRNI